MSIAVYPQYAMNISSSDDESPTSTGMPGSPPDLSLSSSKSSKSSFHSSYQSDDNGILADADNFEDIGLDDDLKSESEIGDFVNDLPCTAPYTAERISKGLKKTKSPMVIHRDLTSKKARPAYPSLKGHVRNVAGTAEIHGSGLMPTPTTRRTFSSSTPSLANPPNRSNNRSPSPGVSPHSAAPNRLPSFPKARRGSWQSNRERKSVKELEKEVDEEDGDEVPDECFLENVPISPRPPSDRAVSMPPSPNRPPIPKPKEKIRPAGNGTPAIPVAQGTLRSPRSPSSPASNGTRITSSRFPINTDTYRPPRAKSWTAALSELSPEVKALTEALEVHADEQKELQSSPKARTRNSQPSPEKPRAKSSMPDIPPLRRNDIMIDPLPISKEKEAVLSRTRPSWLPPKDPAEEKRHLKEYARMMALSQQAEAKRAAENKDRRECRDDTASSLGRIWEEHVMPNWDAVVSFKRTRELWWRGIAPRSRGKVWARAIGNELGLSDVSYSAALKRAREIEKRLAKGAGSNEDRKCGEWFATLRRDVSKTYPDLRIFLPGGPLSDALVDVMMAYVVYRSDVGYVSGLNTATALLLLNLPTPTATFLTLANLLNRPLPLSFHTHDAGAIARVHSLVLATLGQKYPRLCTHLCSPSLRFHEQPSVFLDAIFESLGTAHLSLDNVTRLWDVWAFEGDAVLVRAVVALFGCVEVRLFDAWSVEDVGNILREAGLGEEEDWMGAVRDAGRDNGQPSGAVSPAR